MSSWRPSWRRSARGVGNLRPIQKTALVTLLLSMTIPELVRSFAPDWVVVASRRHAGFLRRVCRADAVAIAVPGRRILIHPRHPDNVAGARCQRRHSVHDESAGLDRLFGRLLPEMQSLALRSS